MTDTKLLEVAYRLVEAANKSADKMLPKELVGVVKTHALLAVGSAWIPVPGADVAAGAAVIWTMYGRINSKLGLSIKENILKTVASGVATNLVGYFAATTVISSVFKFVPGIGTIGGAAIMSATLYAITLVSGYVYMKAICLLAEKKVSSVKEAIDDVLADKDEIKDILNEAKREHKK